MRIGMRNRANDDAQGRMGTRQKGIAMGCRSCNHGKKRNALSVLG